MPSTMRCLLLLTTLIAVVSALHPLSDEFIDEINKKATTWTAGRNFNRGTSMKYIKGLLGVLPDSKHHKPSTEPIDDFESRVSLPKEFDSRKQWPECPSLKEIRDQGSCGSCWAIAAVEVMTDRTCIKSKGKKHFHYSVEDLLSCCDDCGDGCYGGTPYFAFKYWVQNGIVSGGAYNSSEGCQPYKIAPCEHHVKGPRPKCGMRSTPECQEKCISGYPKSYESDLRKGERFYHYSGAERIMKDIFTHGPVEATFEVYADFPHYKSGVYQHTTGSLLGGHAIKIIGWGVENGVDYWLVANSWNTDWGDKGFFKIIRGEDDCSIEGNILSGSP